MTTIPIKQIDPNPTQPRRRFSGLEELAASIQEKGLLEPILVRPKGKRFEIIAGERRYRAARLAGLLELPATIREADDEEAARLALVENLQREDLTPMEEADAFQRLLDQGATQAEVGRLVGKGQSYIAQKLRLLRAPAPLTFYLQEGTITENHVRQVLKLRDIYGEDLKTDINPPFCASVAELMREKRARQDSLAGGMLYKLAPEEKPVGGYSLAVPLAIEGVLFFLDYVSKHKEPVPMWEQAAFWWLTLAQEIDLPVAKLERLLGAWRERYEYARVWWLCEGSKGRPKKEEGEWGDIEALLYWHWHADLRSSSSLHDHTEHDHELLDHWLQAGGWVIYPSAVQHAEKGDAFRERLRARDADPRWQEMDKRAGAG